MRCWGEEAQGTYRLLIRDIGQSCLPGDPRGAGSSEPRPRSCQLVTWAAAAWIREFSPNQPPSSPGDESLRPGTLKQWQLTLYGSSWSPAEMKERQR